LGKNRKAKKRAPLGIHSHVAKTNKERSDYDDFIRTAPTSNPTDEVQTTSLDAYETESAESKAATNTGVQETRSRIITESKKVPWSAISTIVGLMMLLGVIVAFYVSLTSKVDQIDSLVIESKSNTEKIRDNIGEIRERVVKLEVKLDTMHLTYKRSEQCLSEIESIKDSISEIQAQNKELNDVALQQIELRIEKLEKKIFRNK
jgi:hypothetical protein